MGDESDWAYPGDGEAPVHEVSLPGFEIDRHAVSNDRFAAFVAATGWRTDAERFEWSFVFAGLLPDDFPDTRGVQGAEPGGARCSVPTGATRKALTPTVEGRGDHPVVHVSWNDAVAYCRVGGRTASDRSRMGVRGDGVGWPVNPSPGDPSSNPAVSTG